MEINNKIDILSNQKYINNNNKIQKKSLEFRGNLDEETVSNISNAQMAYAKAGITSYKNDSLEQIQEFLKQILFPSENIHRVRRFEKNNIIRLKIGEEIPELKGVYKDDKDACCYFDNNNELKNIYIKDNKTQEIDIYDMKSGMSKHYSKDDIEALSYYKNHPQWLHPKLRFDKNKCSGMYLEELEKVISTLDDIFLDKNKVEKNKENRILYRALQSNLSEEDMKCLQTIGGIFTEKSFCSTTTDLNVAKRFVHYNPILEIEFPKDAEYIDIEKLSNIDREHFKESELLLDRNSHFIVTGFKPDENIIQVKYLGSRNNL